MTQKTKMAASRQRKYSLDLSRYYRKPATQVSLSIVLSLFIIAFFVLVALRPTFVTIASLNQEIEESEQTLSKLDAKVESLVRAAQVWESVKGRVEEVDQAIPESGPLYEGAAIAIEVAANEAGVELSGLNLGKGLLMSQLVEVYEGKNREVIEMEMTARVSGSFAQILRFMNRLLESERLVGVESLTISKETALGSGGEQIGMSVTGTIQYVAEPNLLENALAQGERR